MIPLYLSIPPYRFLFMFFFVQLLLLLVFRSSNNHGSSFVWNIAPLISNVGNMEVEEQLHFQWCRALRHWAEIFALEIFV